MSDRHWSRARRDHNREAIDYLRERSRAPGVAEGGGARNFYCMNCDGVIPHDAPGSSCPHCGAAIEAGVRRYFNWVEMSEPQRREPRVLLPWILLALLALSLGAWYFLRGRG